MYCSIATNIPALLMTASVLQRHVLGRVRVTDYRQCAGCWLDVEMWAWHLKTEPDLNACMHWVVRKGWSLTQLNDWRKCGVLTYVERMFLWKPANNGMFLDWLNLTVFGVSKPGLCALVADVIVSFAFVLRLSTTGWRWRWTRVWGRLLSQTCSRTPATTSRSPALRGTWVDSDTIHAKTSPPILIRRPEVDHTRETEATVTIILPSLDTRSSVRCEQHSPQKYELTT